MRAYYIYNTKDVQGCQDVKENNLTEVAVDRKTRTLFAENRKLLGIVKLCTYICYVEMRQNATDLKACGRGDFVPDAEG